MLWPRGSFCLIRPSPHHGPQHPRPQCQPYASRFSCAKRRNTRGCISPPARSCCSPSHSSYLESGSRFCVAVFDRAGAQFSPMRDVWPDTRLFVRVMKALTCLLLDVELGRDPTVALVHGPLRQQQHRTAPEHEADPLEGVFPTYMISMHGRTWHTVGSSIWTSVSLFGRCTSVWRVRENGVAGGHPALAKFCTYRRR
ncbi:hypothetical protein BJ912DRAFT_385899 [Pholiota molesta]|nr:hypothetical protein BJ912DRAFT_385899 [Pholiota molesta]